MIVAGKYGSVDSDAVSYTQKEYEYAILAGIPVIGFVHSNIKKLPAEMVEEDPEKRKKQEKFRGLVQNKLCKKWSNVDELGAVVSRSVTQIIQSHARPGWVRSNAIASEEATTEILSLRKKLEVQSDELKKLIVKPPDIPDSLARSQDKIELGFNITFTNNEVPHGDQSRTLVQRGTKKFTWDQIFLSFAPNLIVEDKLDRIAIGINRIIKDDIEEAHSSQYESYKVSSVSILRNDLNHIKTQFSALGLIEFHNKMINEKLTKMCKLTLYGKKYLHETLAIKKKGSV
ncbi:MAG: hypothetical protein KOO63_10810 [Bacteroidales bacterium]|nr:hypothetical protein [Candidatus Latescibacterota bacterium]